jgi:hypothetical protein
VAWSSFIKESVICKVLTFNYVPHTSPIPNYRTVGADNVVALGAHRIQIHPCNGRQNYHRARVEIQERMDGSLAVYYQGKCLATKPAPARSPRPAGSMEGPSGFPGFSPEAPLSFTAEKGTDPQDKKDSPETRPGSSLEKGF